MTDTTAQQNPESVNIVIQPRNVQIDPKALKPQSSPPPSPKAQSGDEVTKKEREKYTKIWTHDKYRQSSPAQRVINEFMAKMTPALDERIYDYGCGTGRASLMLRNKGYMVTMVDIAANCLDPEVKQNLLPGFLDFKEACLWEMELEPAPIFFSADVMEHIPPDKVDEVLKRIAKQCTSGGFFQIALFKEGLGELIGEELHLTVESADWWLSKLRTHFDHVVELKTDGHLVCTVQAKRI